MFPLINLYGIKYSHMLQTFSLDFSLCIWWFLQIKILHFLVRSIMPSQTFEDIKLWMVGFLVCSGELILCAVGFNTTLRRGNITYHEYMQVGKGRDVGLNQISKFEAKVANGNSEQTLSRDIYCLGRRFDFFRMLSCYFTTIGFYFNSLVIKYPSF